MENHTRMKLISLVGLLIVLAGCTPGLPVQNKTTSPTTVMTTTTAPATTNQQPVEIVSVLGPLPPINPGGPIVEITVKNVSNEPIASLSAGVQLGRTFTFVFNNTASNPLLPGQSTSAQMTLIGGGFNTDTLYSFIINGTRQNGAAFSYTKQARIAAP